MPVDRMNWSELTHEYNLDAKRLKPWEALNAPFEGAWCVVRPNTVSMPHSHHEREIFIAISGVAKVVIDGEEIPVSKGDIVAVPPHSEHCIKNDNADDFHLYSVWWDQSMASTYLDSEEVSQ